MNAIILSVGDELVLGQTVDTNSAWLSQQLAAVGCEVIVHATVPDDEKSIGNAIRNAIGRCDYLLISGGIGPTEDDLTRQALAQVMEVKLELNEVWLARLVEFFQLRGREMPEINKIQAMIPRGATMIENTAGTAAGIDAPIDPREIPSEPLPQMVSDEYMEQMFGDMHQAMRAATQGAIRRRREMMTRLVEQGLRKPLTRVFVMPGVPKEMKIMFTRDVLPHIQQATGGAVILSRTLHTFGLGESSIAEKLGDLMKRDRNPSVGTTVSNGIVSLRINARYASRDEAEKQLDATANQCRAALGDLIFGANNDTLASVLAQVLASSRKTVTTAESCTGGLLAKMLTDIPGSSDFFKQGWITYSNKAKTERLGVSENILNVHGAVSEPVVEAMATAARRLSKADFSLAISGIAGPGGGTEKKPVGTVCIALAHPEAVAARTFLFTGDREMIRDRAAKMALAMLRFHLLGRDMPF
jgi:nicotinamide-nucleotide amidase